MRLRAVPLFSSKIKQKTWTKIHSLWPAQGLSKLLSSWYKLGIWVQSLKPMVKGENWFSTVVSWSAQMHIYHGTRGPACMLFSHIHITVRNKINKQTKKITPGIVVHAFHPSTGEAETDKIALCELEVSLVYAASFRPARWHKNPIF